MMKAMRHAAEASAEELDQVAAARAEVLRLATLERDWSTRRRRLAGELGELERTSGDEVLSAALEGEGEPMARSLAGQIAGMRAELETIDRTVDAARRRREQAIPAVFAAEAGQLRLQASALTAEADGREPKTRELLAAIEAWEGCPYAPVQPNRGGQAFGGPAQGGAPQVVYVPTPKTTLLRQQAAALERQAVEAERRTGVRHGSVTGRDLQAIEEAVFADPLRMGPPPADIEAWMNAARDAETTRRSRAMAGSGFRADQLGRIEFTLVWSDGIVRPDQSTPASSFRAERR